METRALASVAPDQPSWLKGVYRLSEVFFPDVVPLGMLTVRFFPSFLNTLVGEILHFLANV